MLVYPMKPDEEGGVWMQQKLVDGHTAEISMQWVLLFKNSGKDDEIFVTNFV